MNDTESIKSIFPILKQQLLFLRERKKVFDEPSTTDANKENETIVEPTKHFICDPNSSSDQTIDTSSNFENAFLSFHSQDPSLCDVTNTHEASTEKKLSGTSSSRLPLPEIYHLPFLPSSLVNDIENGDLSKFNNHCKNRKILLDEILRDLTKNYNIWYVVITKRTIFRVAFVITSVAMF